MSIFKGGGTHHFGRRPLTNYYKQFGIDVNPLTTIFDIDLLSHTICVVIMEW